MTERWFSCKPVKWFNGVITVWSSKGKGEYFDVPIGTSKILFGEQMTEDDLPRACTDCQARGAARLVSEGNTSKETDSFTCPNREDLYRGMKVMVTLDCLTAFHILEVVEISDSTCTFLGKDITSPKWGTQRYDFRDVVIVKDKEENKEKNVKEDEHKNPNTDMSLKERAFMHYPVEEYDKTTITSSSMEDRKHEQRMAFCEGFNQAVKLAEIFFQENGGMMWWESFCKHLGVNDER